MSQFKSEFKSSTMALIDFTNQTNRRTKIRNYEMGKYCYVYTQQTDGTWKIARAKWNTATATTPYICFNATWESFCFGSECMHDACCMCLCLRFFFIYFKIKLFIWPWNWNIFRIWKVVLCVFFGLCAPFTVGHQPLLLNLSV